jgi:hypothetical protein
MFVPVTVFLDRSAPRHLCEQPEAWGEREQSANARRHALRIHAVDREPEVMVAEGPERAFPVAVSELHRTPRHAGSERRKALAERGREVRP